MLVRDKSNWDSIRKLFSLIGNKLVPLYYWELDKCKTLELTKAKETSTGGSWMSTGKIWHINTFKLKSIVLSPISIVMHHGIHIKVFSVLLPQHELINWAHAI